MRIFTLFSFITILCIFAEASYILDDFTEEQLLIQMTESSFPLTTFGATRNKKIVGGERDLIITATDSLPGMILRSAVLDGLWDSSTPHLTSAFFFAQYDGKDNSSSLDTTGLGGLDFNTLSPDKSFSLTVNSDSVITVEVVVYDMVGGQSIHLLTFEYPNGVPQVFLFHFATFIGTANFSNVGAVVIQAEIVDSSVSLTISDFILNDLPVTPSPSPSYDPHPSRTPSRTRTPSQYGYSYSPSRTRTPIPLSVTRTPSPTKTPFWDGVSSDLISSYSTDYYFTTFDTSNHINRYSSDDDNTSTTVALIITFMVVLAIILLIAGVAFFVFVYPRIKKRALESPAPINVEY